MMANILEPANMRMIEACDRTRPPLKRKNLDRNYAVEPRVASPIHHDMAMPVFALKIRAAAETR
jgi:hypothetical protein